MRFIPSLRLTPLKLHTKTTILVSAVLVAIFAVIVYFSDLALTSLSNQEEQQAAQLVATRVANTVEHHIRRETRRERHSNQHGGNKMSPSTPPVTSTVPDWTEVQDEIYETIIKTNQQLAVARVFYKSGPDKWDEKITLVGDAVTPYGLSEPTLRPALEKASITTLPERDHIRYMLATWPVIAALDDKEPKQIGAVSALLAFDQTTSYAARLRSLIWPVMLLGIITITLITYFLFRHIVYEPIGGLLLAMSKAEEGDLTVEVDPLAPDEIGLLTARFNRMLGRIRQMTEQLNQEHRRLEDRVQDATAEIAERKEQLEVANLRLFELQRHLTQLERLAAAGQLAAQFAHEVGTPLNLISGHVQLLRARASQERVIKRLDIIAGQIERITNIVRTMLDSTRRPVLRLEELDINSLLARILDAAQPTLAARNVELQTEMSDTILPIKADPDQLQQVIINLINNGLDAMPGGGRLRVSTASGPQSVFIEMADNGEGIAADEIDLIFDPLFTTKQRAGTGLGLTIVKQIILEHGGSIDVESKPGEGTCFRISLPQNADSHIHASDARSDRAGAGSEAGGAVNESIEAEALKVEG